jgi:hypothetical protein
MSPASAFVMPAITKIKLSRAARAVRANITIKQGVGMTDGIQSAGHDAGSLGKNPPGAQALFQAGGVQSLRQVLPHTTQEHNDAVVLEMPDEAVQEL